jgi:hypothetical protein
MAYVGIDGHKKQCQMCLLTAAGEICRSASHATEAVRGGLCQAPHSPHLGVTWRIVPSKGAACSPAAHDVLCCWTGAAAWGRVAPLGWRQGDGYETGGCGRLGGEGRRTWVRRHPQNGHAQEPR